MRNIREEIGIYIPTPLYMYWTATWLVITPALLLVNNYFFFFTKDQNMKVLI